VRKCPNVNLLTPTKPPSRPRKKAPMGNFCREGQQHERAQKKQRSPRCTRGEKPPKKKRLGHQGQKKNVQTRTNKKGHKERPTGCTPRSVPVQDWGGQHNAYKDWKAATG